VLYITKSHDNGYYGFWFFCVALYGDIYSSVLFMEGTHSKSVNSTGVLTDYDARPFPQFHILYVSYYIYIIKFKFKKIILYKYKYRPKTESA